ncbi:DUF4238 domain-containing protein [Kordiimonas sp.]|uniref:DUF4238 domain-containing protein n=1 Tax=Kordiimonas sp. TaxID=1970157 RepID=UPI003A94675F
MKHHFVPQFLLRSWVGEAADSKLEVFRLDLPRYPSKRTGTKFTGYEDDLYALSKNEIAGMQKQDLETRFHMAIDDKAAKIHQKLIEQGFKSLSSEDRIEWVRFLTCLLARQPDIIHALKAQAADVLIGSLQNAPEEYDELALENAPACLLDFTEQNFPGLIENFGLSFYHEIAGSVKAGQAICDMKWWLWDFSGVGFDLVLSDRPCILTKGISEPDTILALPISPQKAFIAAKSDKVAGLLRKQDPKGLASLLNESSFYQARKRVYARNDRPRRFFLNRSQGRTATGNG